MHTYDIHIYIYDMHITPLPSVCIYAPFIHFHRMKEQGGGGGGQARPRKEVSRRFIHYYF